MSGSQDELDSAKGAAEPGGEGRLDSWKAIANHLGRTVRTVQRWEKSQGLPVYRLQHDAGATIYAFRSELDRWHAERVSGPAAPPADLADADASGDVPRWRIPVFAAVVALLAVGAWLAWRLATGPGAATLPDAFTAYPVTTRTGIERFPTLSPDGEQLAFLASEGGGPSTLYVRRVGGGDDVRLSDDAREVESPRWSPDGQHIAFLRRTGPARREIVLVPPLGGPERRLHAFDVPAVLDDARSKSATLAWSPDSRWLVYTEAGDAPESLRLSALRLSDGARHALTSPRAGVNDLAPAVAPDGGRLAFTRSPSPHNGHLVLARVDLEAGTPAEPSLTLQGPTPWNTDPLWTADGRELVFSSGRWPRGGLWRVPANGREPARPLAGAGQQGSQPTLARLEGAGGAPGLWRLAYTQAELDNDIWRFDLLPEGSEASARATASRILGSSQRERFPAYAPTGSRMAFLSDRSGYREVWVADAEGEMATQWTEWRSGYVWRPSWSPDGAMLAYSVEIEGRRAVYVQDRALAPGRRLTQDEASDTDLAWANDGRSIYVASPDRDPAGAAIWRLSLEGAAPQRVAVTPGRPLGEGPAGEWFYYAVAEGTSPELENEVERIHLARHDVERIALEPAGRHSLVKGPDGIYFVADTDDALQIRRWSFSDGTETVRFRFEDAPEYGMSISPDGRRALLARISVQRSDIVVADELRSAPR